MPKLPLPELKKPTLLLPELPNPMLPVPEFCRRCPSDRCR
jgi:hypothetical protein